MSTFAGLTALIGTRIYPVVASQNVTLPFVTFQRISAVRTPGMGADIGIVRTRFQIDVIAGAVEGGPPAYPLMRAVMTQVRLAIQRYRDAASNPEVLDCFIENEQDLYEDETDLHHGVLDVIVHHRE